MTDTKNMEYTWLAECGGRKLVIDYDKVGQILELLASGSTYTSACETVGITPKAFYSWRKHDLRIEEACQEAKKMFLDKIEDDLIDIAYKDYDSLEEEELKKQLAIQAFKAKQLQYLHSKSKAAIKEREYEKLTFKVSSQQKDDKPVEIKIASFKDSD